MPAPRLPSIAVLLGTALLACGCQTTVGPTSPFAKDAMGRASAGPRVEHEWRGTREGGEIGAQAPIPMVADWQWTIDAGTVAGTVDLPGTALGQGLRASVATDTGLSGLAASHALAEGVPEAVLVGFTTWPEGASPATVDAMWTGAKVRVEWLVSLHGRTACSVDLDAMPRLVHPSGCTALLDEFRVRRTLALGESLVVAVDPARSPTRAAEAVVGAHDGRGARFVVRVRP